MKAAEYQIWKLVCEKEICNMVPVTKVFPYVRQFLQNGVDSLFPDGGSEKEGDETGHDIVLILSHRFLGHVDSTLLSAQL